MCAVSAAVTFCLVDSLFIIPKKTLVLAEGDTVHVAHNKKPFQWHSTILEQWLTVTFSQ